MATTRQNQVISQLNPILKTIAEVEPASLVQKDRLGSEFSFEYLLPLLTEVCSTSLELLDADLQSVPYGVLQKLVAPFQQIQNALIGIRGFSSNQGNPIQARETLGNTLEDQWSLVYLSVKTIVQSPNEESVKKEFGVLTSQVDASIKLSSDAAESLRAKQKELEETLSHFLTRKSSEFEQEAQEKLKMVTAALEEVRKAAAEAGVSQTAVHFKEEAREHEKAAWFWLGGLIAVTVALLLFSLFANAILSWTGSPEPAAGSENIVHIRYLSQKGLIVFCLIFALIWAARNYGASRHNYVVNKHRNNALGSFQAFVTSATDEQTKNAVLIQATQSIFSPQPSGYVKTDGENAPNTPILEIVRAVGGTKEK
jgi:hypothetical protein